MAQLLRRVGQVRRRIRRHGRSNRIRTILAPALPALLLVAITTAGMIDPPQAGLASQLHLTSVATVATGPVGR